LRRAPGVIIGSTVADEGRTPYDALADATGALIAYTSFTPDFGTFRKFALQHDGVRHFAAAAAGVRGRPGEREWIDFHDVPVLSFTDVLGGFGDVEGKIVLVGAIDPIFHDVHPTPFSASTPGVEIQASAVDSILDGLPLHDPPGWLAFALIVFLGVDVPLVASMVRGLRWLPVPLVLGAGYLVAAQLSFDGGTVLPVAAPLTALVVGSLATLAISYTTDVRRRRRLRESFGRFVPDSVVDEVAERGGLPGEERVATVLFADLRGFTALAESLGAPEVIALLNRYLSAMSDAILDHGGTVVSYMGDGIMAVFGAPVAQDDHADRAVAAAREMLRRLPSVGGDLRMGIGLCSGPVMSGTVGSARRMEYTAVGDTTNTAARLEAMTKEAGVDVLIADETRQALRDPEGLRSFGEVEVRGRQARLTAWTFT
jgi:adenylate cyclase